MAAVTTIVMMRITRVGRTFTKLSIEEIRVSEPPYMFRAVTETRPSAKMMSAIVAEAGEQLVGHVLEVDDGVRTDVLRPTAAI